MTTLAELRETVRVLREKNPPHPDGVYVLTLRGAGGGGGDGGRRAERERRRRSPIWWAGEKKRRRRRLRWLRRFRPVAELAAERIVEELERDARFPQLLHSRPLHQDETPPTG